MGKIRETRKLYKESLTELATEQENWKSFLDSSSWNFKYDFDDQILIYAQRPDAKACATMEEWNKKLKRWVNPGTKPIYIFDKNPYSEYPFKLVFDLSDTHNYNNTEYKLWRIKKEYEQDIIESLEASFGDISAKESLAQAIILSSYNMVADNMEDYLSDILKNKANSKLDNIADDEIRTIFMTTVWASVSYMIMTRCGINARENIDSQEFSYINYFDKPEILTILGSSVSDIAEMGLREIAKTIANLQKSEKLKKRTIAKFDKENYANDNKIKEGVENNGENKLHETGRLLYAKSSNEKGESTSRQIRIDEIQLPKESQELRINQFDNERETSRAFDENTGTSNNESRTNSETNGNKRWSNRRNESKQSNGMGGTYEQLQDDSRGDSGERTDLRLDLSIQEQLNIINQAEVENTSVFTFSQENIDEVLVNGSGFEDGKFRIFRQFQNSLSNKENALFLKNEYGIGGRSWKDHKWINYGSKGISMEDNKDKLILSWNKVEKRIGELIKLDRYLNSKEKEQYSNWLKEQERTTELEIEQIEQKIKPSFIKNKSKIQDYILHPEIPLNDRNNYKIADDNLGIGTPKEKFDRNIEAIKILKKCEEENRYATPEEQEILAQYVGWGGLQQAFNENDNSWSKEYKILKELLNEEEYRNARESVLTAFYTPPIVIKSIYEILLNMGLKEANILEPACRCWKFYGKITKRA